MIRKDIRVRSSDGGDFDCYLVAPETKDKVPAIVIATAVHGVDGDHRDICDEFAAAGFIAAAPDLFWRTLPGPLPNGDKRLQERSQPRKEKIATGETDMKDVAAMLRAHPNCNGKLATIGFCYGGPYAILGPTRLGYDAGVSCHGSLMGEYIKELDGTTQPICIMWGDKDHAATPEVQAAYRAAAPAHKNMELHIWPDIKHGYMMKGSDAYDRAKYEFSMARAKAILSDLTGGGATLKRAS
jgi:carboxymethylenebutenolidase